MDGLRVWMALCVCLHLCTTVSAEVKGVRRYTGECFMDKEERFFRHDAYRNESKNTVSKCIEQCREKKYRYAGLEYGKECFCGHSVYKYPRRPLHECDVKCTGSTEMCGGVWRISVYSLEPYYDLREVLTKSILFYEAQRSGKLPANNRIAWRGDSALHDHGKNGEDLSGGWYTSGGHAKNNFISASATTVLSWGLLEYWDVYKDAGQLDWMLQSIKWPLKYLMKSFVKADPTDYEFYVQVQNPAVEDELWQRAEDIRCCRPTYKIDSAHPGSDAAAESAAALAAGSMVFKGEDPCLSDEMLQAAKDLFNFATFHRGRYSDSITVVNGSWPSTSANDEIVWAAAWMYMATRNEYYLEIAEKEYNASVPWAFDWDDKNAGFQLLLYKITGEKKYKFDVRRYLNNWLDTHHAKIPHTWEGLAFRSEWGSLRYSANTAFLALLAADLDIDPVAYRKFAASQVHYMLGKTGRSFVVGFGENPPKHAHHSGASCDPDIRKPCGWTQFSSPDPNPNIIYGALVGGPDSKDKYTDVRSNYKQNEVTVDYNAGFQSTIAAMLHMLKPKF